MPWLNVIALAWVVGVGLVLFGPRPDARLTVTSKPPVLIAPESVADIAVPTTGTPIKGSQDADLAIIVFSDFQCPYCGRFARETLPALNQGYINSGQVLVSFRHFPLAIHPDAMNAATATACAGVLGGRFWEMHDALFAAQHEIGERMVATQMRLLNLASNEVADCRAKTGKAIAERDAELARTLGVTATPTFFLGKRLSGVVHATKVIRGAAPLETFQRAIAEIGSDR